MKLYLVRHGETEGNSKNIIQGGGTHGILSEKGINQVKKTALELKNKKIDVAYVSDLNRTKQTASELLKYHPNVKIIYDERLREKHFGDFENKKAEEYLRLKEEFVAKGILFVPNGGESPTELELRVKNTINDIIGKNKSKNILIVGHGTYIRYVLRFLLSIDIQTSHPKYSHSNAA
ncbi:histidine phosphatase family protein, partial [Candidatus Woesearchaeota archaeon]|nr:histidine phosphatase family protein [Candidatus Woesearchaeota archaeon]